MFAEKQRLEGCSRFSAAERSLSLPTMTNKAFSGHTHRLTLVKYLVLNSPYSVMITGLLVQILRKMFLSLRSQMRLRQGLHLAGYGLRCV